MIWLDAMHHYQRRTSINPYSLPKPIGLPAWSLHHNYFKQKSEKKTKSEPESNTNEKDTERKVDLEIPKLNEVQIESNGDYPKATEIIELDGTKSVDESKEELPKSEEPVDFLFANPLTRKPELNENIFATLAETEAPPIGFEDDYEIHFNASLWKETWCTPTPPKPEYLSRHLLEMRGRCQFNVTNTLEFFSCVSPLSCRHIGWLALLLLLLAAARLRSYAIAPAGFMRVSLRTSILACAVGLTLALCCEAYLHAALQLSMPSVKLHPADNAEIRLYMRTVGEKLDHASAILTYPYRGRRVDLETTHKYHHLVNQLVAINTNISKAHQGPEEYFYIETPFTKAFLQFEHVRFQVLMVFWPLVLGVMLALAAFKFYLVATIFGAVSCAVAAVTLTTEAIAVADCCEAPRIFMDRVTAQLGLPSEEEHIRSQYNRVCGAWLTKFQKKLQYYEKQYAIVSQEMRQHSEGDQQHHLADIAQRITRVIEVELPKLHGVTTPRCDYQFKSVTTVSDGDGTSSHKQALPGPIYLPPADSVVRTLCHRDRKLQLLVAQIMLMMAVGTLMNLCVLFGFVTMKSLNSESSPLNKLRTHIRRWKDYNVKTSSRKSSKIRTQISKSRKSYSLVPRPTCVMGFTTTDSLLQYPTRDLRHDYKNDVIPPKRRKKFTRSPRQKLFLRSKASPTEGPWRLREDFTKHEKDPPKSDTRIKKPGWFFFNRQPKAILNKNTSSQATLPHQKSGRSKKRESPEDRLQTLFTTVYSQSENSFRVLCSSCESIENFMNSSFNMNIRACPADVSTSKANNNKRHRRVERKEKRVRRCPIAKKSSPCNCGHSSKKKKKRRSKRPKHRSFKNYFRTIFEEFRKKKRSSIFSKNKHKDNPSSSFHLCRRCSKVMQKKRRDFSQSVYPQPTSFEGLKFKRKDIACQVNRISSQNLCGPLNSVSSCHCVDRDKCPLTSKTFLDKAVDSPKSSELSNRVSWGKITKTSKIPKRKVPKSGSKSSTYRTKLESTCRKNSVKSFEEKINEVRERRAKPKKEKIVCPNKKIKKKDPKRCKQKYTKKGVVLNTFCDKCQVDHDEEENNSFHENIYEKVYPEHKISNFLRPESLLKNLSFKSNYCERDAYIPSQNCSPKPETSLKQYDSLSSYFDSPQEYVPMCSNRPLYENTGSPSRSWEQSYQPEPEQEPKRSLPTLLQSLMKKQRR